MLVQTARKDGDPPSGLQGKLVFGAWFLVPGSWFLVLGSWFLVLGAWCLVLGSSSKEFISNHEPRTTIWFFRPQALGPKPYIQAMALDDSV